jgi:hypothetical protein
MQRLERILNMAVKEGEKIKEMEIVVAVYMYSFGKCRDFYNTAFSCGISRDRYTDPEQ